jgi:SAM-dependent methyltransferase
MKLNLGCGRRYLDGWVNCDLASTVRTDRQFDLNRFPYPFEDGVADEILLDNVLEHLDDVIKVVEECHRLLKPGGHLRVLVPYGKTDWALQDPTHKHFFTEKSMDYFLSDSPFNFYTHARFHLREATLHGDATTLRHRLRNALPFKNVLRYFLFNIYDGIRFDLEKV